MNKQKMLNIIYEKIANKEYPVMIGDVLDYFEDLYSYGNSNLEERSNIESSILSYWKDKRKPIEEQPIECIEFIYYFIK